MEKIICQRCQGNGYIKVKHSVDNPVETIQQCPLCNSQGEIMSKNIFEETRKSYRENTERLILETELVRKLNGVIKKLNDEVDTLNRKNENLNDAVGMLTKQKEYLQSKLREKGGVINEKSNVGSTREEIRG